MVPSDMGPFRGVFPWFSVVFKVLEHWEAGARPDKDSEGFGRLELAQIRIWKDFGRIFKDSDDFLRFPKISEGSEPSALWMEVLDYY